MVYPRMLIVNSCILASDRAQTKIWRSFQMSGPAKGVPARTLIALNTTLSPAYQDDQPPTSNSRYKYTKIPTDESGPVYRIYPVYAAHAARII